MAWTNISNFAINEAFTAEDWNKFIANAEYNRTQFQVHHASAGGHNLNQGIEVVSNELRVKNHSGMETTAAGFDFSSIDFDAYVLSGASDDSSKGLFGSVTNAINAGNTKIFVGPGTFTESEKEEDIAVLVGSGAGRTIINWSSGSTENYGIKISGLLTNVNFNYTGNLNANGAAVILDGYGIAVNSYISSNHQNALYLQDAKTAAYDCYIKNANNYGVRSIGLVTGCYIEADLGFHTSCGRATGNILYVSSIANLTSGANVFSGNACAIKSTGGIILDSHDNQIIGNTIIKVSGAAGTNLIRVIDDRNIIMGNTLDGLSTTTNGLLIDNTADRTIVAVNIIQSCTNNYVDNGVNTQAGANITT